MENALPKRKTLRLQHYDYSCDNAYFITICTQNKACFLSKIHSFPTPYVELTDIGKMIEESLLSIEQVDYVFLDKYVIMPNHIHAIIIIKQPKTDYDPETEQAFRRETYSPGQTLSHLVGGFKRLSNKKIGKNIFQRSFYDHIIRDQNDYDARCRYILENPKRWLTNELYIPNESF